MIIHYYDSVTVASCSEAVAKAAEQEKHKLVNSKAYTSPIQPSSAFHLRNRLLSRIGTKVNIF